jgi:hypothetical protein
VADEQENPSRQSHDEIDELTKIFYDFLMKETDKVDQEPPYKPRYFYKRSHELNVDLDRFE